MAQPIVTVAINDFAVVEDADNTTISLFNHFDDPFTTGQVARFELYDTSLGGGVTNVVLFDQPGEGAPLTVQNFLNYVNDEDYDNSIIHRSIPGFVVQGGGFTVEDLQVENVPTDPPVTNEFSPNRSNLEGTIAMAKVGSNPDSATSQWFFNLGDNSANLDNQNGGFTVFGEVLSEADMAAVDAIAALPTIDQSNVNSAFMDLPVISDPVVSDDDLVRYSSIRVSQEEELEFFVVGNSNPGLVDVTISGDQLILDYAANQTGTAEITIRATSLTGNPVEDTFLVTVQEQSPQTTKSDFNDNDANDILFVGSSGDLQSENIFWDSSTQGFESFEPNLNTPGLTAGGIGDLDGDGNADIVYQDQDGTISVLFSANQSNARWDILGDILNNSATLSTPGLEARALFDADGDGRDEILFYQTEEGGPFAKGTNFIYHLGSSTEAPVFDILTGSGGGAIVTPDLQPFGAGLLNGDTTSDIIFNNPSNGETKIFNRITGAFEDLNPNAPDQTIPGLVRGVINLDPSQQDVIVVQGQADSTGPLPPWAVATFNPVTGELGDVLAVTPDFVAMV